MGSSKKNDEPLHERLMRGQLSRFDLALDTEISPERSSFIESLLDQQRKFQFST
jgi:hypothetical protein